MQTWNPPVSQSFTGQNLQTVSGNPPARPSLSQFSDEEIAREHHFRMMKKLGDQMVGVSIEFLPGIG